MTFGPILFLRAAEDTRLRLAALVCRDGPDAPADLCVLSEPPATVLGELDAGLVAATVLAGELVLDRG